MAETAWPSNVRTEYDPDKAVRTGRAAALVTRSESLRSVAFQIFFNAASTTSASYVTLATIPIDVPDWAPGRELFVVLEAQRSLANAADWRMIVNGVASSANAITSGAGVYAESQGSSVGYSAPIIDSIQFQARIATAGTVFLRSILRCTSWFA